ncbi:glycosyltransferase family 2 protein [Clostridium fallax]|uniref:Glycosyl transferase family 2 n=1 Tax=Clostridium fallax TaxID=1533 RepID=A0A1M4WRS1_9CLOT|nr:glycosyltransferase family A protein [Clostridium fallax]SHE83682.1 Glycosyl transferase family 2 [Clostridium fallax]SQB06284.1 glycosyl transferase family protein [Clostridium fallax]
MEKNDLVSVVIPYYNNGEIAIRALKSALNQTYKNIEIILIDDGSSDNSFYAIEKFIEDNKLKDVINITQKNKGPSAARNNGVKNGKGKYIAFLDSDDSWVENKLEIQMKHLISNRELGILGSDFTVLTRRNNKSLNKDIFKEITFYQRLFKNYFHTSTVIIKREVFDKIGGFNEEQRYAEDQLLFTKAFRISKGGKIEMPLVNIYKEMYGESGLSKNLKVLEKYEINNFKILRDENSINDKKISLILYYIARIFSYLKYIRRIFITKIRRFKINSYGKSL